MNEAPHDLSTDGPENLRIPMDSHQLIAKEKLDQPFCTCGQCWIPLFIPAMRGYVRQCPTCTMTASYCQCDVAIPNEGPLGTHF